MIQDSGVWFGERFLPLTEVRRRAAALAEALPELGVPSGSLVVMLARNSFLPVELSLAAAQLGVQVIPISSHSTAKELSYVLADSGACAVIGDADLVRRVADVVTDRIVIAQRTPDELVRAFDIDAADRRVPVGAISYDDLIQRDVPDVTSAESNRPDLTLNNLFYTSGTTGQGKGVVRQAATPAQVLQRQATLDACFGLSTDSVGLVATPLCHMFGASFAQTALRVGCSLVLMPRFDALTFLELVERHSVTEAPLVPTMFVRLLRLSAAERSRHSLESLRRIVHSGAPCARAVKEAMIDWMGPVLWEQYGSTETGVVALCDSAEWLAHRGSVGRGFLGSEIAVYDSAGRRCPPGVTGEVHMRMHGTPDFSYLGRPEARAAIERDGLISAGDIGELDADGFLYLHDRRSDLVLSGGNNIYPAEVENELGGHPAVEDCAVFGVPDDEFGQRLIAAVALRPGTDVAVVDDLTAYLRAALSTYKVPREVVLVEKIPRNEAGKVQRARARDGYLAARSETRLV